MTSRKKPGWAFWTTVVVTLTVLYVASVGPVTGLYYWLASKEWISHDSPVGDVLYVIYWPVLYGGQNGPRPIAEAFYWYLKLWGAL